MELVAQEMFNKLLNRFKTFNDNELNLEEFRLDFRTLINFGDLFSLKLDYANRSLLNHYLNLRSSSTIDVSNMIKLEMYNQDKTNSEIKLKYFSTKLDYEIKLPSKVNYNLNLHSVSGFSLSSIMKLNLSYSTMRNLRITFMRGIFICNSKREMIFRVTLINEQKTFEFQLEESILNDLLIRFNILDKLQLNPNVSLSYNSYWKLLVELKDTCQEYSSKNNIYWAKCEELSYLIDYEKSKGKEPLNHQLKTAIKDEKLEDLYSWNHILLDEQIRSLKIKELKEAYLNDISNEEEQLKVKETRLDADKDKFKQQCKERFEIERTQKSKLLFKQKHLSEVCDSSWNDIIIDEEVRREKLEQRHREIIKKKKGLKVEFDDDDEWTENHIHY